MKKFALVLLSSAVSGSAFATCPNIEGKYIYTCTVTKDKDADFADVLEVAGQMAVLQKGCDAYHFTNLKTQIQEEFLLTDVATSTESSQAKIHKSSSTVIKFTTVEKVKTPTLELETLKSQVTKGTIREKRNGFVLKGKERSRVLGVFGKKHSKFKCRFIEEN